MDYSSTQRLLYRTYGQVHRSIVCSPDCKFVFARLTAVAVLPLLEYFQAGIERIVLPRRPVSVIYSDSAQHSPAQPVLVLFLYRDSHAREIREILKAYPSVPL